MSTQVPIGVVWRKSSRSNGDGNVCVEIAFLTTRVAMRDSKSPGATLTIPVPAWGRFRGILKDS